MHVDAKKRPRGSVSQPLAGSPEGTAAFSRVGDRAHGVTRTRRERLSAASPGRRQPAGREASHSAPVSPAVKGLLYESHERGSSFESPSPPEILSGLGAHQNLRADRFADRVAHRTGPSPRPTSATSMTAMPTVSTDTVQPTPVDHGQPRPEYVVAFIAIDSQNRFRHTGHDSPTDAHGNGNVLRLAFIVIIS